MNQALSRPLLTRSSTWVVVGLSLLLAPLLAVVSIIPIAERCGPCYAKGSGDFAAALAFWSSLAVGLILRLTVTGLQGSRQCAMIPGLIRALRFQTALALAGCLVIVLGFSIAGAFGSITTVPMMAATITALALGLSIADQLLPGGLMAVWWLAALSAWTGPFPTVPWLMARPRLFLPLSVLLLAVSSWYLLRTSTFRKRPFSRSDLAVPDLMAHDLTLQTVCAGETVGSWWWPERFLRLNGSRTSKRLWRSAAVFETTGMIRGGKLTRIGVALSLVFAVLLLLPGILRDLLSGGIESDSSTASGTRFSGDAYFNSFLVWWLWMCHLLETPRLSRERVLPLSRHDRFRIAFTSSSMLHLQLLLSGLAIFGVFLFFLSQTDGSSIPTGTLSLLHGLLVASVIAPAAQCFYSTGTLALPGRSRMQGIVGIGTYLLLYSLGSLVWFAILRSASLTATLATYVSLLIATQTAYFFFLRRHFQTSDLTRAIA